MALMVRTGIPVSVWLGEGDRVISTAFDLIQKADEQDSGDGVTVWEG